MSSSAFNLCRRQYWNHHRSSRMELLEKSWSTKSDWSDKRSSQVMKDRFVNQQLVKVNVTSTRASFNINYNQTASMSTYTNVTDSNILNQTVNETASYADDLPKISKSQILPPMRDYMNTNSSENNDSRKTEFKFRAGNDQDVSFTEQIYNLVSKYQEKELEFNSEDDTTENVFSPEVYSEYHKTMFTVLKDGRFKTRKKKVNGNNDIKDLEVVYEWLFRKNPVVDTSALSMLRNEKNVTAHVTSSDEVSADFKRQLRAQRDLFLSTSGFTDVQYEIAERALSLTGNFCAKSSSPMPLQVAWMKLLEAGIQPEQGSLSCYLYVFSSATISSNDVDMSSTIENLHGEVAFVHDTLYKPTEKTISVRIRQLVASGDASSAEGLIDAIPSDEENSVKLRTCLPILQGYCDQGDCVAAFKLFERMRNFPQVYLEPENYCLIVSTLTRYGYFGDGLSRMDVAEDLGYSSTFGPHFFDEVISNMASDVLEINFDSARLLYNAFLESSKSSMREGLEALPPFSSMPLESEVASNDELVVSRVSVNEETAICSRTNAKLRLLKLEGSQRLELHDALLNLAKGKYEVFLQNSSYKNFDKGGKHAYDELKKFSSWLKRRKGKPFTAIVDGANVGYKGQNNIAGKFNYYQIEFLMAALESIDEHPLIIMPYKYTQNYFTINIGGWKKQVLTDEEKAIIKKFKDSGQFYVVPRNCLDDFYWMLASVSNQEEASEGEKLDVSADEALKTGRFTGTRPLLLSNDEMRDHKIGLFHPRIFRRWANSHIVNYNFAPFIDNECVDPEMQFSAPDVYSREIQCNESSNSKAWHFPVTDWGYNERLVIRLPPSSNS